MLTKENVTSMLTLTSPEGSLEPNKLTYMVYTTPHQLKPTGTSIALVVNTINIERFLLLETLTNLSSRNLDKSYFYFFFS